MSSIWTYSPLSVTFLTLLIHQSLLHTCYITWHAARFGVTQVDVLARVLRAALVVRCTTVRVACPHARSSAPACRPIGRGSRPAAPGCPPCSCATPVGRARLVRTRRSRGCCTAWATPCPARPLRTTTGSTPSSTRSSASAPGSARP